MLKRTLQSIGYSFFIKYYYELRDLDKKELLNKIIANDSNYQLKALETRISNSKSIFFNNKEFECLKLIEESKRTKQEMTLKCIKILNQDNLYFSFEETDEKEINLIDLKNLRAKFFFSLITQDRFNKKNKVNYQISFIKQLFHKSSAENRKKFDDFINNQIDNIKIIINEKGSFLKFKEVHDVKILDGDIKSNFGNWFTKDFDNLKYVKFNVTTLEEISIDHDKAISKILKEKQNCIELEKITELINFNKNKKINKGKRIKKILSELSDDSSIHEKINYNKLLEEIISINEDNSLILMHRTHNNRKRAKV